MVPEVRLSQQLPLALELGLLQHLPRAQLTMLCPCAAKELVSRGPWGEVPALGDLAMGWVVWGLPLWPACSATPARRAGPGQAQWAGSATANIARCCHRPWAWLERQPPNRTGLAGPRARQGQGRIQSSGRAMCESLRSRAAPRQRVEILAEASPALLHSGSFCQPTISCEGSQETHGQGRVEKCPGPQQQFSPQGSWVAVACSVPPETARPLSVL